MSDLGSSAQHVPCWMRLCMFLTCACIVKKMAITHKHKNTQKHMPKQPHEQARTQACQVHSDKDLQASSRVCLRIVICVVYGLHLSIGYANG